MMQRGQQFEPFHTLVTNAKARAVRKGHISAQSLIGGGDMSTASNHLPGSGTVEGIAGPTLNWQVPKNAVAHATADFEWNDDASKLHDPDAPVSVLHRTTRYDIPHVQVNDPSVIQPTGVRVPTKRVDLRGYLPAAHGTSPEIAEQVAHMVRQGHHGLLMSEYGAAGPGVYAFFDRDAQSAVRSARQYSSGPGAVIEGIANPGRTPWPAYGKRNNLVDNAAESIGRKNPREQQRVREMLRERGVGHVPDGDGGAALLHPSQFRVTAIHTPHGTERFDPSAQRFREGDRIWSPETFGK